MEKPNGDSKIPQGLKDTRNEKAFRSKKQLTIKRYHERLELREQ